MKYKSFWLRMVPMVILVIVTVVMSIEIFFQMVQTEEEVCWNRLEVATNSTAAKIHTRITDSINFLTTVANAYTLTSSISSQDLEKVGEYLKNVEEKTIFERIDVILPDDSVITQAGESSGRGGESSYEELVQKGTHITQRRVSSFTGEKVICAVTPIETEGEVFGVLVGTINCSTLSEIFEVFTYGREAQLFLIDRADGNYLMDNWHTELGNIYDIGTRYGADDEEVVDFVPAIINGKRERFIFQSKQNGEISYQYCAPVEDFNWEVCVAVQEDIIFANVRELEKKLYYAGAVELFVVFVFVVWNVCVNITVLKSEEKVRRLEFEKAKNEARETFISNMSHDIKTPLNGIVGMLQIIRNHRKEEAMVDDCLNKIEISAKYLSTLTSDILDISEIENDKLVLDKDAVNLCHLIHELDSLLGPQAKEAGIMYSVDYSNLKQPHIIGSGVHIKRILVNLIGNAIKYSKNAGKNVWVTICDEEIEFITDKRMYRFIVKDNGIGMSEEFQKNMYKAFEQETIDARSTYQGYGLGLTIVNHLVKKMNGTIELDSTKHVGSTFTVSIPLEINNQEQVQEFIAEEKDDLSGLKILLVEDNDFNMEIAKILLTDAGASVDTAVNGKLAAEMFAASTQNTYDMIVMDVMMPVMDGCEATKVIREMKRPDAKSIPIIAMTAGTFSEDILRCMEAGMDTYIPKPLDVQHMMATIAKYCT